MTLPRTKDDREFQKFSKGNGGETLVNVKPFSTGSLLEGISFDYIAATYPTASSEVYTYKTGGNTGATVATITVTYSDATKEELTSIERF